MPTGPTGCPCTYNATTTIPECGEIVTVLMEVDEKFKVDHFLPLSSFPTLDSYEKDGLSELLVPEYCAGIASCTGLSEYYCGLSTGCFWVEKCTDCLEKSQIKGVVTWNDTINVTTIVDMSACASYNASEYEVWSYLDDLDGSGSYDDSNITLPDCLNFTGDIYKCSVLLNDERTELWRGVQIKAHSYLQKSAVTVDEAETEYNFVVAHYNYLFVPMSPGPDVANKKDQYTFYNERSAINNVLDLSSKPVYYTADCPVSGSSGNLAMDALLSAKGCITSLYGDDFPNNPDDSVSIAMTDNPGILTSSTYPPEVAILIQSSHTANLAHELGHIYGTCDEYYYPVLNYPGGGAYTKGYFYQLVNFACTNPIPDCCLDSPTHPLRITVEDKKDDTVYGPGNYTFGNYHDMGISGTPPVPSFSDSDLINLRNNSPCSEAGGYCEYTSGSSDCGPNAWMWIFDLYSSSLDGWTDVDNDYCPQESLTSGPGALCCFDKATALQPADYSHCHYPFDPILIGFKYCAGMPLPNPSNLASPFRSMMALIGSPELHVYPQNSNTPLQ